MASDPAGLIAEHTDHEWEQVGRCVWCKPCSVRLYQGEVCTGPEKEALAAIYAAAMDQHRRAVSTGEDPTDG